jgi:hypothetical protein
MKVATFLRALASLNAFALSRSGRVIGRLGAPLRVDQSSTAHIARQIRQAKNNLCDALLRDSHFTQDPTPDATLFDPFEDGGTSWPGGTPLFDPARRALSLNREGVNVPPGVTSGVMGRDWDGTRAR